MLGLAPRLDVLVNNVGGIFATRTLTADGYESALAVNFLAPVVLTHSVPATILDPIRLMRLAEWAGRQWHRA
jgi:NAD(P)-dependent dehydrogenase (short-subunit alcohol dehydrogenase family)